MSAKNLTRPVVAVAEAFVIVADMEEDVAAVGQFADALALISETLEERQGLVVQRLAYEIKKRCEATERDRGQLIPNAPCRSLFDRVGWPAAAREVTGTVLS